MICRYKKKGGEIAQLWQHNRGNYGTPRIYKINTHPTPQATGQTASFEGINLHTVNEAGLTTHLVQSTDLLSYFIQVGALPSLFEPEEEQPDLEGCGTVSMGTKAL